MTDAVDLATLGFRLRGALSGEVRFDPGTRHLYAGDASNYRHLPLGVVLPRSRDDVAAALELCREHGAPVTLRGGGTSLAGQAVNRAVVVDVSRHLTRVVELDPDAATARVEPGVVLGTLQAQARPAGLRFGPDPSTADRCTLGGMLGNDACGAHSLRTGRTLHQVDAIEVLLADGTPLQLTRATLEQAHRIAARDSREGRLYTDLLALRDRAGDVVSQRFAALPRLVSGYRLEQLTLDDAIHPARALVGSEGTCAVVVEATIRLVPVPPATAMALLAYPSLDAAAAAATSLLDDDALMALEGIDDQVLSGAVASRRPPAGLQLFPKGHAWLIAEVAAEDASGAAERAEKLARSSAASGARLVVTADGQRAVWTVRADALGAGTFAPDRPPTRPGWEDAGLPPDRVPGYLRDLRALLDQHGLEAAVFGHFGDGCVHTKISFDHASDAGRATFRRFVEDAADLTIAHGGSLSGEHGDGQARGELLEKQFGATGVELFRDFKRAFDPDGMLNPGRVVDAAPLDLNLRWTGLPDVGPTAFTYGDLGGSFATAVDRCVGVGACRRTTGDGTMCPSFRVTRDEQHSTRGRARLLSEMLRPDAELDGWRDEHVREALDLCLSCKACAAECPTGVDVARFKAEFLHRHWRGRLRPPADYALGLVRWWLAGGSRSPALANALAGSTLGSGLARRIGLAAGRPVPPLAPRRFSRLARNRPQASGREVLVLADTFVEHLDPEVGVAALDLLEDAGFAPRVVSGVCCGRPLFDVGMLGTARRQQTGLVEALAPAARRGAPVVVLEPSCLAALRDELPRLLDDDPAAAEVAAAATSAAELLAESGWQPPQRPGTAIIHPHCHQQAVWGAQAEAQLLDQSGATWEPSNAGCCGLAGGFGFRAGDPYGVSVAVGERLTTRIADAGDATLIADGWSCRSQISHLSGRRAVHLLEYLADPDGVTPIQ